MPFARAFSGSYRLPPMRHCRSRGTLHHQGEPAKYPSWWIRLRKDGRLSQCPPSSARVRSHQMCMVGRSRRSLRALQCLPCCWRRRRDSACARIVSSAGGVSPVSARGDPVSTNLIRNLLTSLCAQVSPHRCFITGDSNWRELQPLIRNSPVSSQATNQ